MKRIYFILATVLCIAFNSCTNEEFVGGEDHGTPQAMSDAITFGSNAGKLTRATSNTGTVAQMLDGHFKVYGVKKVDNTWKNAFKDYIVWNSNNQTTSNPDATSSVGDKEGWEYVGTTSQTYGADNTHLPNNQTIKYWDYSATEYHFVAGSPASAFTFNLTAGDVTTATVAGLKGHITKNPGDPTNTEIAPIYIATPVKVAKTGFKSDVEFTFNRQQTFVRVGVFETIPGYRITKINFYEWDKTNDKWGDTHAGTQNIILASTTDNYFCGSGTTETNATITYNWTTTPISYSYDYTTNLVESNNWYGGELNGVPATTSVDAGLYGKDKDMAASTGYFTVLPTKSSIVAAPILVKCDYELTSDGADEETINVTGATAAIPAAFTKWLPNTTYTYLFKISANTNGTTGTPGTEDPEGLFPISFDAVVTAEEDGTAHGVITSVSTPSITTYQAGSIIDQTTTPSVHGIRYVHNKLIYLTAQNDETGELLTLSDADNVVGSVKVYELTGAATEADMQLNAPTGTIQFTLGSEDLTFDKINFTASKYGYFTPTSAGYYAIQYLTKVASGTEPAAYTYKIVYVE